MTSWREIQRLRKDANGFRTLARGLLASCDADLNDWERDFLEGKINSRLKEFSVRQAEALLQMRDDLERVKDIRGFSVETLLRRCCEARADLSDDDEAWVVAARENDPVRIRRRAAGRLLRCARQLNLVETVDA